MSRQGRADRRVSQNRRSAATADSLRRHEVRRWDRRLLGIALLGSGLLWAALPPLGFAPLAWIAPVGWLWLVRTAKLPGSRPYTALWAAGFLFWFVTLQWLRLPHWATSFGWLALSGYLAFYLPVFVGLSRVAVHRLKLPLVLATPLVWMGLELARGHLLTGFTMASLGHTQYAWLHAIQVADLGGAYLVGGVVLFVAACLARCLPCDGERWSLWPLLAAGSMIAATLAYGEWRMASVQRTSGPRIALIQGSIDTTLKADSRMKEVIFAEYYELSREALRRQPHLDLIVWPETMFREALLTHTDDVRPPDDVDWTIDDLEEAASQRRDLIADLALALDTPTLIGIDTHAFAGDRVDRFNSALHVSREGEILGRYDKMHPVMFGEYVPLAEYWPWLYRLTPLEAGLSRGAGPVVFDVQGTPVAASICYENVLPHLIAGQVRTLRHAGGEPAVLVNLTNDGWFWGSSELDLHLICGVFRAVECRKPSLIAANTGFSAVIDGDGRIVQQGRRRATSILVADVELDSRSSLYVRFGDWPAGLGLATCVLFAIVGLTDCWRSRRSIS